MKIFYKLCILIDFSFFISFQKKIILNNKGVKIYKFKKSFIREIINKFKFNNK